MKKDSYTLLMLFVMMSAIFLCVIVLFGTLFISSIRLYPTFDIEYSDLTHDRLTFVKHEEVPMAKAGTMYKIYFKESSTPFVISHIVDNSVNLRELRRLEENQKVEVYYMQRDGDHTICEMTCDSITLLSLSDYVKDNQHNHLVAIVFFPVLVVAYLIAECVMLRFLIRLRKKEKRA